ERIEGLDALLRSVEGNPSEMVFTSLTTAIGRFQLSYHAHTWWEQILDLMTAMEAILSGRSTSDVTLRLKTRAAALLATSRDPAQAIFNDVDQLYQLRSKLVHGGEFKLRELERNMQRISTVPDGAGTPVALNFAVDRLRDIVRRALLARMALASPPEP